MTAKLAPLRLREASMIHPPIRHLHNVLDRKYGERVVAYSSTRDEENGFAFRVQGIEAIFSAIVANDGTASDLLDVQVESDPSGDYVYTSALRERWFGQS